MIIFFLLTIIILSIFGFYRLWKQKSHRYIEDMASYPTKKVMLNYGLFGGAVGGFLLYLVSFGVLFIQDLLGLYSSIKTNTSDSYGELVGLIFLVVFLVVFSVLFLLL